LLETDPAAAAQRGTAVLRYLETPDGIRLLSPDSASRQVQKMFGGLFAGNGGGGGRA